MPGLGCLLPAVLFLKFSGISLTKSVYFLTAFSVLFWHSFVFFPGLIVVFK